MVLIQPPAGWTDTPSDAAATTGKTAKSTTASASRLIVASSFHEIADLSGIDLTTPAGPSPTGPPPVAPPAAAVERWSRWVVWGSVAGSVAIATVSLMWSLRPGSDDRAPELAPAPVVADPPPTTDPPQLEVPATPPEPTTTVANKPAVEPQAPGAEAPAEFALPEPPAEPSPPEPTPQEAVPKSPPETVATNAAPRPAIDPRDVDPENLDLVLRKNPAEVAAAADIAKAANADKLPAAPGLHIAAGSEDATRASLEQALSAAAKQAEPENVRRGPTSAADLPPVNVAALLEVTIPDIDVPRLPLHRAVEVLAELTAIPIILDPAALRMAGLSVEKEVAIRGKNATAAELIRTTLAGTKLQYEQRGDHLIVVRPGAAAIGSREYSVEDLLAPGASDASELAQLIQTVVAPQSWDGQGGDGRLTVEKSKLSVSQLQAVHYDALIFCELLRKARGLPLQSKYPAELLRTKPLETALAPRLDRQTTFSFVTWTPLPHVFRHWEKSTELHILVDWSALADVQLAPASTIACAVEGVSWREALDGVLQPLGLAWVAVDESTIQITSRAAAEALQYIEFYPLAKVSDAETLVAELREATPGDHAVVFDAASRSAIVRANVAGHRHVATQLALVNDAP